MSDEALSGLDLDLLRTLEALLHERHVSSAATKLGITQPTMSQRLKRLREIFRDPLLVSGRNGLHLTPRAAALRNPLQNVFTALGAMLRSISRAGSVSRDRRLRVAVPDFGISALDDDIQNRLAMASLDTQIEISRLPSAMLARLSPAASELCLFYDALLPETPAGFSRQFLFADSLMLAARSDHWLGRRTATIEELGAVSYVSVVAAQPMEKQLAQFLTAFHVELSVTAEAPSYESALEVCRESDLVMMVPAFLGRYLDLRSGVSLHPLPCFRHGLAASLMWRSDLADDSAVMAIRADLTAFLGRGGEATPLPSRRFPLDARRINRRHELSVVSVGAVR